MTRSRIAATLAATCLIALVGASPALAGQIVWKKGSAIWVMNDDGSSPRQLIGLADAPGMSFIGSPHVHPLGGQTVAFTGSTTANNVTFGSRTYSGNNSVGVYLWQAGAAARMSGAPSPCTTGNTGCSTYHREPEMAADGSYVFQAGVIVGDANSAQFRYDLRRGTAAGDSSDFPTQCSGENSSVFVGPDAPSPNPVNAAEVAYIGCDPADPGSDFGVWIKTETGAPLEIADSPDAFGDPSWTLDGSGVLVTAKDPDPSIYLVSRDGATATKLFAGEAADPRDIGGRILFESGSDIYTIPSTCSACTLADATKLTTGADNGDPAWTSAAAFAAPPGPGPGPGGGGDGADVTAPSLGSSFSRRLRLGSVLSRGLSFRLTLGEAARVQTTVSVDSRTLRRYRLLTGSRARRARSLTIGRATRTLAAGRAGVRVKITRKYARKLRRARSLSLRVTITATDAAGNKSTSRKTVRVRR